jgi:ubiquinone/menaquinone biosynthesis C-methylase UbiE
MRKNYFAGEIAENYDRDSSSMFNPAVLEATVDFLAELAGDGAALELGIGTGRVALPLSARGVPVQGIDLSPDMVAQLQAKPGAAARSGWWWATSRRPWWTGRSGSPTWCTTRSRT